MNLVIVIVIVKLIAHIMCIQSKGVYYTIITNKRGVSDEISHLNVDSILQCAVQCSVTNGCYHANFKNNGKCELLQGALGSEIATVDQRSSNFIGTYHVLTSIA